MIVTPDGAHPVFGPKWRVENTRAADTVIWTYGPWELVEPRLRQQEAVWNRTKVISVMGWYRSREGDLLVERRQAKQAREASCPQASDEPSPA